MVQGIRAGWWLKLDHGKGHCDQLEREIVEWMTEHEGEPSWMPRHEFDPDLQCIRIFVDSVESMPPRWGLLLGDALHNVRCALDHMAWYLAVSAKPRAIQDERRVAFPICDTRHKFASAVTSQVPGVSPAQRAIIERHQPFPRGEEAGMHPLALLQSLDNADKHRELRMLVPVKARNLRFTVTGPPGSQLDRGEITPTFKDKPTFQEGEEVGRVYGWFDQGQGTVTYRGEAGIALEDGLDPKVVFDAIHVEVSAVLQELEATF